MALATKMKTKSLFITLIAGALCFSVLAACGKEENTLTGGQVSLTVATPRISESDNNTEITRSGSTSTPAPQTVTVPAGNGMTLEATLEPSPQAATRAVTQLAAGVKYRVIAFEQDNVTAAGYKSHADFEVGTDGTMDGDLHVPAGDTYTFVCYSLNSSEALPAFDADNLNIAANPATNDLLYTKFNQAITQASKTLSFSFEHQFSLITVIADATKLAQNITAITATLSPNYPTTMAMADGALTAGTAAARSIPWGTVTAGETITATDCTVFTNASSTITVSIPSVTIGTTTRTNLKATFGTNAMQQGYKYTLRLKFKAYGIVLAGVTWAEGNLIYTGTYPNGSYSFASTQEYYTGTWNGGDYWGWCQLNPTVTTAYTGDYSVAVDPCQMVDPAGTWRMPTNEELQNYINAEHTWTTRNGVFGRYFGISSVPATGTENNYVFLPAAGWRSSGNTTMNGVDQNGYYWSATPNSTTSTYRLGFYDTNVYTNHGARNYGFSIRCVK